MKRAAIHEAIGIAPCLLCHEPVVISANKRGFPYQVSCGSCGLSAVHPRDDRASLLLLGRMTQWEHGKDLEILDAGETPLQPSKPRPAPVTPPSLQPKPPAPAPAKKPPRQSIWEREIL